MNIRYNIFIILMFFIAALSDMVLHYLSFQKNASITMKALRPYYRAYGAILSPILAGITVIIVFIVHTIIFTIQFLTWYPHNMIQFGWFILWAILLGILADIIIHNFHIFGNNLNEWYKLKTSYIWGFVSYLVALFVSYICYNMLRTFNIITQY